MHATADKRERLGRFVDLARVYRGWTKTELSAALHRDPTKLIPQSGNPKLDLIAGIADALDWTIGDVAESVCENPTASEGSYAGIGFERLNEMSLKAHRSASFEDMVSIGQAMLLVADDPVKKTTAFTRLSGGFNGMGRYANALRVIQAALTEPDIPLASRFMLHMNLANAHYTLWHLVEAKSIAGELIEQMPLIEDSLSDKHRRARTAFLHYVRGNAMRRMIAESPNSLELHAGRAREDILASRSMYDDLAEEHSDSYFRGLANVCAGAELELDAALGSLDPVEATDRILEGLDQVVDPVTMEPDIELESWGWWAIFGCNIALRHLEGELMQRQMAVFTNKAIEIGERLGNWAMRERAFTLEHFRRQQADLSGVRQEPWPLDEEDIRVITGTMGRFPAFREVGWQILQNARVLEAD